ncbi:MAG: hypothetical protein ABIJ09_23720 [Pseudomonadota bacterium]
MARAPRNAEKTRLSLTAVAELAILACLALWLGLAMVHPPFWGLMDDHLNLYVLCPEISDQGFAHFYLEYVRRDIVGWGMMRLIYPLQVFLFYCHGSPWLAAASNLVLVIASTWLFFWSLARAVGNSSESFRSLDARRAAALGTLSCVAFFWYHDFFLHVSLQEKTVLLWIAVVVAVLFSKRGQSLRPLPFSLLSGGLLLAGLAIKGQFAIALPLLGALQLTRELQRGGLRSAWRTAVLVLWGASGTLVVKAVAMRGPYASRFTLEQGWHNLHTPIAILFLVPILLVGTVAVRGVLRHRGDARWLVDGASALSLIAFLVVLAPVGLRGYVLAFSAPWLVLPWLLWLPGRSSRVLWAVTLPTAVLALTVTGYRSARALERGEDLRHIVASPQLAELARRGEPLRVPCVEGSAAIRRYVAANQASEVVVLGPDAPRASGNESSVWFHDSSNCPLGRFAEELAPTARTVLIAPSFAGSYTVERFDPSGSEK